MPTFFFVCFAVNLFTVSAQAPRRRTFFLWRNTLRPLARGPRRGTMPGGGLL